MIGPVYATREQLREALDVQESARRDRQLDRHLQSGARAVEGELHRRFYPEKVVSFFDWPSRQYTRPWRLWLDQHEMISVEKLVAGGAEIAAGDYLLYPQDGPPFDRIEVDLSSSASFRAGVTHQRAIEVHGLRGYRDDEESAGQLAASAGAASTSIDVSDAAAVGVGHILHAGDERMIVTDRRMIDTGQDLGDALAARADVTAVTVDDGDEFAPDQVILIGAERMQVVDIAGDQLVVRRAVEGTVLGTHGAGADVYASRRLTVRRGALGTTAASHSAGTPLTRHVPPAPVSNYNLALAINSMLQERAGYARTVGSAESEHEAAGRGLRSARAEAWRAYARKARIRGV